MQALIHRIFSYKFFPLSWTLLIIFLLCIPGSYVPGTGLFSVEGFDKIVHVILFGCNVLFWGWHYNTTDTNSRLKSIYITIVLLTAAFGVIMEFVQMYWVPNRSFDAYDIVADITGAVAAGAWLIRRITNVN
jgi:hypothetical protein